LIPGVNKIPHIDLFIENIKILLYINIVQIKLIFNIRQEKIKILENSRNNTTYE